MLFSVVYVIICFMLSFLDSQLVINVQGTGGDDIFDCKRYG